MKNRFSLLICFLSLLILSSCQPVGELVHPDYLNENYYVGFMEFSANVRFSDGYYGALSNESFTISKDKVNSVTDYEPLLQFIVYSGVSATNEVRGYDALFELTIQNSDGVSKFHEVIKYEDFFENPKNYYSIREDKWFYSYTTWYGRPIQAKYDISTILKMIDGIYLIDFSFSLIDSDGNLFEAPLTSHGTFNIGNDLIEFNAMTMLS